MTSEIGLNTTHFLQLNNDIRISSTSTFNAQEAYENTFEDVLLDVVSKTQEEKQSKIAFSSLGVPAGFFMDTSLLSEEDRMEINSGFGSY